MVGQNSGLDKKRREKKGEESEDLFVGVGGGSMGKKKVTLEIKPRDSQRKKKGEKGSFRKGTGTQVS